jgi:adenosylmethionine-8-amino-7-oxononanoate aminotransferase
MKMAIQYWKNKSQPNKKKFIALKRGYHGDTLGVMSLGTDDDTMHATFQDVVFPQYFVSPGNSVELEELLQNHHHQIAGFFVEPILQGAGGFHLHDANYLKKAKALCKTYNVLFIADEVATGFGRTGTLFAVEQANITPDIIVLGKALTGGYLGLAATLATTEVFESFYDDDPSKAFMHGPTFTGNPLACSVALKSIEVFERDHYLEKIKAIETELLLAFKDVKSPYIKEIRIKGSMACIEVLDEKIIKKSQESAIEKGVWLRPFGNFLYTMPPAIISNQELKKVCNVMLDCLKK